MSAFAGKQTLNFGNILTLSGWFLQDHFLLVFNAPINWKESVMLILTRSYEQSVIINGNIKITILGIDRGVVKLGFEAPDDVAIVREELLDKENPA